MAALSESDLNRLDVAALELGSNWRRSLSDVAAERFADEPSEHRAALAAAIEDHRAAIESQIEHAPVHERQHDQEHLTRVYAKLDVDGRADLAAQITRRDL